MAEKSVSLQHIVRRQGDQLFHFYDGAIMAHDGLLTIPANREAWLLRAWRSGYVLSPEGERLMTFDDVIAEVEKQNAKSVESSKTDESSDGGRQSKARNRVRESESTDSDSTPEKEALSDSSGSTDESEQADPTRQPITLDAGSSDGEGRPAGQGDGSEDVSGD